MPTKRMACSVREVAEALGVSRASVYELTRTGGLESIKIGSRILIPRHTLDNLLNTPAQVEEDTTTDTEAMQEN